MSLCQLHYLCSCSYCQERSNIYEPLGTYVHKHQLSPRLVPQNCSPAAISALPPTLWIHELLPCHSQSPLKDHQSDLSKWRNVKMLVSGLTFHLHWQLEEHNSAPGGAKKVLHSDSTIQSDNWPQYLNRANSEKCFVPFRVNYIVQEFGWRDWGIKRSFVVFFNSSACCLFETHMSAVCDWQWHWGI